MRCNMKYLIGVDLGGTKISSAISDLSGNILYETVLPTLAKEGEEAVLGRITGSILELMERAEASDTDVACIGIGTPGIIMKKEGRILRAYNLPFKDYDLLGPIRERFGVPCVLENDANAAALGEYYFGRGEGKKDLIYVTVSTGVGGGAVIGGRLLEGSTGNAFEVGHMIIDPKSSVQCNCGLYGDLEALASGTAITKRAESAARHDDTLLKVYERISPKEVYEAYLKGDKVSEEILREAFTYIGVACANLITLYNPQVLVLGGGVSTIGEYFFSIVKESAKRSCLDFLFDACEIMPSGLGKDTGLKGALAVARTGMENL